MWFACATALLACAACALALWLDARKPRRFPPGPAWLPLLGSCLAVRRARASHGCLVEVARRLAAEHRSGWLGLRVGKDRVCVANDMRSAREMLLCEDLDGRPMGLFYETRTWGQRRGIVLTDQELWREQRKFIVKHLREFGFGTKGMWEIVQAEAEHLVNDTRARCRENGNNNDADSSCVVAMTEMFGTYILNTLWAMMAGRRYDADDAELNELQELLFELFANIDMIGAMFSHFPLLKFIAPDASGYNRFLQIHQRVWRFLRRELDAHQRSFDAANEDRDFMDAYTRAMRSGAGRYFDDSQLLAICMDLFMAGTETTNKSMGFLFLHLVREPRLQENARREIDAVVGRDRLPTVADRAKMPYCEALVLESIRHFMGRTFGIPHRALKDTEIGGYVIPKDATVLTNFNGIMMNEQLFAEPYEFRPERFLADEGTRVQVPEQYVPFGIGRHRCMGEVLAKTNIFMFMTTVLQSFEFAPLPGEPLPTSAEHIDGATPSVVPYRALVRPRVK